MIRLMQKARCSSPAGVSYFHSAKYIYVLRDVKRKMHPPIEFPFRADNRTSDPRGLMLSVRTRVKTKKVMASLAMAQTILLPKSTQ